MCLVKTCSSIGFVNKTVFGNKKIQNFLFLLTIMNGCFVDRSTRFSVSVCSTSSFCMTTSFFSILMAYKVSVDFSRHKITLPNVPLPKTFKNSKFSSVCRRKKPKNKSDHNESSDAYKQTNKHIKRTIFVLPLDLPVAIP